MEQAVRDDLYQHLQRLDPAFHDEWQSGQLLSRARRKLLAAAGAEGRLSRLDKEGGA